MSRASQPSVPAETGAPSAAREPPADDDPRRPPPGRRSEPPPEDRPERGERRRPSDVFRIEADALPPGTLLMGFSGREALSELYRFDLSLMVPPRASQAFDPPSALGQRATISIQREDGEPRWHLHGMIAAVELDTENVRGSLYRATLVPHLWKLSQGLHSRVWVGKTTRVIVEELFKKHQLTTADYEFRLSKKYTARNHVCQYREADLDFVSRWLEHEGIYWFFEHGDEKEKLILTDDGGTHTKLEDGTLRYFPTGGRDTSSMEALTSFAVTHTALPKSVRIRDYNYLQPDMAIDGDTDVEPAGHGERIASLVDNLPTGGQARRIAATRAEELGALRTYFEGRGRVYSLRPGYRFELDEHPREAFNAEYLAVEVDHAADMQIRTGGDGGSPNSGVYQARVRAVPKDRAYRPPRVTPKPLVDGFEIALVDGEVDSDYAQLDEHGRYLVKFQFDENTHSAGQASMRLRMLQPHGGNPEGQHFPLRKGTEVLVVFGGGDPDRPIIASAVPNALTPAAVVSDNHMLNVIHTGGDSHLEFSDEAGKLYVDMSTPPEKTFMHLGAHRSATGFTGDAQHNSVASTAGNGSFHTGTDTDITVGKKKTEDVTKTLKETYGGPQATTVTAKVQETYKADLNTTVASHCDEEYGMQLTTTKGHTEEKSGSQKTTVKALLVETHGTQSTTVDGSLTEKSVVHLSNFGPSTQHYGSGEIKSGGVILWNSLGGLTATVSTSLTIQSTVMCAISLSNKAQKGTDTVTAPNEVELVAVKLGAFGSTTATVGTKIELIAQTISAAVFRLSRVGIGISLAGLKNNLASGPSLTICGIKIAPSGVTKEG